MNSSSPSRTKSTRRTIRQKCLARLTKQAKDARRDAATFARFAFTDPGGRPLKSAAVHGDLQTFLSTHPRALVELPRDHGKSVQVCVRVVWELGQNPGLRVKMVCATEALAAERGRFLRSAIADNPRVRVVFPDLRPAEPWEATRFTIDRPVQTLDPSVTCLGVGTGTTGARADLLICDDIVDVKALRSKSDRDRVKAFFRENLMNILEPGGRVWCLFTPWTSDDLNSELTRNELFAHFRRAVGPDLEPVWAEHWPRQRLAERRQEIGSIAFARAYRLVCVADDQTPIKAAWVRTWDQPAAAEFTILAVDPAVSTKARADASALVVLTRTTENEIHCREATAERVDTPDLVRLIDAVDGRFNPDEILFESNAAFEGIAQMLIRQTRFGPKVRTFHQTKEKFARVSAFSVSVENGSFRLKGDGAGGIDPGQQALFDEMTAFPFGDHDDLLDAAAFGTAHLLRSPEPRVF